MAEAHRLGFRVMLHVNYFGCDPKHPSYATMKQWQVRDPFSGELQWWEWPAEPPIKFAYINPASRAWREMFVKQMVEVAGQYDVDAFHLDQTLCIYNDKNGMIDGCNFIEGSLALHRELRRALPEVALSGEGLNEITCQYEHFAQRHIWGMDHAHRTWDDRQVAMSHAISSAVLAPYTRIYGYLGMANPNDTVLFNVWRRAYEPFGVLPTYNWPDKAQFEPLSSPAAALLEQARFFQKYQPAADFDTPWQSRDLFVYRLKGGGQARFRRDQGVAFEAHLPGQPPKVLERRIEGVSEATLPGSIPGWPAFDAEKIIGLNPNQGYSWSAKPRDLAAPHLSALPAGYMLSRGGVQEGFARFQIAPSPAGEAKNTIRLWDYTGSVTGGVRLAGGVVRTFGGLEFADEETAGGAHPDGDGLFIHPPWKGVKRGAEGRQNVTFLDYPLTLPDSAKVFFTSGIQLKPGAEGKSDGVTFRAVATCGGEERRCAVHHATESTGVLELDLSPWRGKSILLHLEADPGPAGALDYDWGRFVRPRIAVQEDTVPAPQPVRLAGFARPEALLVADGEVEMTPPASRPGQPAEIQAKCRSAEHLDCAHHAARRVHTSRQSAADHVFQPPVVWRRPGAGQLQLFRRERARSQLRGAESPGAVPASATRGQIASGLVAETPRDSCPAGHGHWDPRRCKVQRRWLCNRSQRTQGVREDLAAKFRLGPGGNQPGRVENPAGGAHIPDGFTQRWSVCLGGLGRATFSARALMTFSVAPA